ncbi:MAG: hypothetical protein NC543_07715 [bacterium]|nr:hypothetical protein [bacterium]MCM1375339.1 hypothetical protein [Muribaculum sp.]
MKKKKLTIVGIMVALAIIVGAMTISQSPRWSEKTFEAIVQETLMQSDGEIRLIVERTTGIYGSPVNSLGISENTKLLGKDGNELSINDFQQGNAVTVTLKDAFTEEAPYYYPTVYKIKIIDTDK